MIKITNLSHEYRGNDQPTLRNISLQIQEGEYVVLIGPNGSGKTSLVRHLNALITPQRGEVEIDGLSCRDHRFHVEIRRNVGMVFQNPDNQIVGMTVEEDVAFGPGNLGLPSGEINSRVKDSLALVGLSGYEKRSPFHLSGGEKQLLALAGLLAVKPKYIILDETTSALDPGARTRVLAILDQLRTLNMTIIHVTHNMEEAIKADRVLLMQAGEIVGDGTPRQILADGENLRSLGLAPPLIVELMDRLEISAGGGVLTVEEAARLLNSLMAGTSCGIDGMRGGEAEDFV